MPSASLVGLPRLALGYNRWLQVRGQSLRGINRRQNGNGTVDLRRQGKLKTCLKGQVAVDQSDTDFRSRSVGYARPITHSMVNKGQLIRDSLDKVGEFTKQFVRGGSLEVSKQSFTLSLINNTV